MKSKTLSKVTWVIFLWFVLVVVLISNNFGMQFLNKFISIKETNILYGLSLFLLFISLLSRVTSYLGLSANKGRSIEHLIFSYRFFYILLTDEARQEWRDFIAKEQARIKHH